MVVGPQEELRDLPVADPHQEGRDYANGRDYAVTDPHGKVHGCAVADPPYTACYESWCP